LALPLSISGLLFHYISRGATWGSSAGRGLCAIALQKIPIALLCSDALGELVSHLFTLLCLFVDSWDNARIETGHE